jgi:hypothetical protein
MTTTEWVLCGYLIWLITPGSGFFAQMKTKQNSNSFISYWFKLNSMNLQFSWKNWRRTMAFPGSFFLLCLRTLAVYQKLVHWFSESTGHQPKEHIMITGGRLVPFLIPTQYCTAYTLIPVSHPWTVELKAHYKSFCPNRPSLHLDNHNCKRNKR